MVLSLLVVNYVRAVTVREMFPFGPEAGDLDLLQGDYYWEEITLQRPVTAFGIQTSYVEVMDVVASRPDCYLANSWLQYDASKFTGYCYQCT